MTSRPNSDTSPSSGFSPRSAHRCKPAGTRTTVERVTRLAVGFIGDACAVDAVEQEGDVRRLRVVHSEPAKTALADAIERIVPRRPHVSAGREDGARLVLT